MAYIGRTKTPAPLTSADIPDGIVTAADLAPDSVGTSEIADSITLVTPNLGTVATGNLSNTAIVYPTRMPLQIKTQSVIISGALAPNGTQAEVTRIAFTPTSASSKIVSTLCSTKNNIYTGAVTMYFYLRDGSITGSDMTTVSEAMRYYYAASADLYYPISVTHKFNSWSGLKTLYWVVNTAGNTANASISNDSECTITLMEYLE